MELIIGWLALAVSALGLIVAVKADRKARGLESRLQELHDEERARVDLFIADSIERGRRW